MQFSITAKIVRRFGQFAFRIYPITILGVYAAGCDLQKSKISATVVGSAIGACTTSDCETSFESYAGLSPLLWMPTVSCRFLKVRALLMLW